jgi:hypothetical protein
MTGLSTSRDGFDYSRVSPASDSGTNPAIFCEGVSKGTKAEQIIRSGIRL